MAIKLEVGKYYKTRDGRKVGPMGPEEGSEHLGLRAMPTLTDFPDRRMWWNNGRANASRESAEDLIAEWAEPKFKVGDRVRCVRGYPGGVMVGEHYEIKCYSMTGTYSVDAFPCAFWEEDRFVLSTSPVRERTIKEVVEWSNGKLHVMPHEAGSVLIGLSHPYDLQFTSFTAEELTDAITHLTAIRDALVSKE